ncbi:adhesion G protein-coupled receptor E3-like, partial [Astyanax mexicanus]
FSLLRCWFKEDSALSWSFYGPVYCILAVNMILFIAIFIIVAFTLKKLSRQASQRQSSQRSQTLGDKKVFLSVLFKTIAQFVILGCPWVVSLINRKEDFFIFVILISLQGIFIFLVHCVFDQEVREKCIKWMRKLFRCRNSTDIQRTEAFSHTQTHHHD